MSEYQPEYDLNHHAPEAVMSHGLNRAVQHDSLRFVLEQTPKAVLGGVLSFPQQNGPARDYFIALSRYEAPIDFPSSDASFFDIHVMRTNDSLEGQYMARFVLSDQIAYDAQPGVPLTNEAMQRPLSPDVYRHIGELLAFADFNNDATDEAVRHLEWWHIIEPQGTIDAEFPDMPLYDLTSILKQEWSDPRS
jgi:hypothetical protein